MDDKISCKCCGKRICYPCLGCDGYICSGCGFKYGLCLKCELIDCSPTETVNHIYQCETCNAKIKEWNVFVHEVNQKRDLYISKLI